jgi:hypothetical protein
VPLLHDGLEVELSISPHFLSLLVDNMSSKHQQGGVQVAV